jgi:hypothetical protein
MRQNGYFNQWNTYQSINNYYEKPSKKTKMNPSKAKWIREAKVYRKPLNVFRTKPKRLSNGSNTLLESLQKFSQENVANENSELNKSFNELKEIIMPSREAKRITVTWDYNSNVAEEKYPEEKSFLSNDLLAVAQPSPPIEQIPNNNISEKEQEESNGENSSEKSKVSFLEESKLNDKRTPTPKIIMNLPKPPEEISRWVTRRNRNYNDGYYDETQCLKIDIEKEPMRVPKMYEKTTELTLILRTKMMMRNV